MKRPLSHSQIVAGWLNDLAVLTAGLMTVADAKAKAAGMCALLAEDFSDDGVFNRESLKAVAEDQKFFPAYSEVKSKLGAWWAKYRPTDAWALPAPVADAPLSDDAKRWAAFFLKRVDDGATDAQLTTVLSMIRGRDNGGAAAYEWLIWKDHAAAAVARARRLPTEAAQDSFARIAREDWSQPALVEESLAKLMQNPRGRWAGTCLALLRFCVGRHAPENLGLLPERLPEITPPRAASFAEQMEAVRAAPLLRPAAALTDAQVAEVRKNPTDFKTSTKSGMEW